MQWMTRTPPRHFLWHLHFVWHPLAACVTLGVLWRSREMPRDRIESSRELGSSGNVNARRVFFTRQWD
jgi:hypothetical protein